MNDYEAHLSSYDHTHKQRLKDMKAMVKDPSAGARARKAEAKADGLVSLKVFEGEATNNAGGGFKKGGFRKSGFKSTSDSATIAVTQATGSTDQLSLTTKSSISCVPTTAFERATRELEVLGESDPDEDGYGIYDPRRPTD
ncbi:unnamed protein product [Parascedosporium putredinis]|uniref:Uncharacterized protein n=1 Tax=Parascedosporium putredinis TaxID=1442378 RepID=A0A9P1H1H7_9PEZI|nr:unnamed protein product [Parascedosporium putredinis]CAI7993721.1 unnamed protein product [Parascedosporium putredinis]